MAWAPCSMEMSRWGDRRRPRRRQRFSGGVGSVGTRDREREKKATAGSGTGIICSRAGTVLAAGRLAIAIDETGMATAHESSCRPSTVSEPVVPCPFPFQPTHLRCAPTSYHRVRSASPVSHDGSEISGTSGPDQTPPANPKPNQPRIHGRGRARGHGVPARAEAGDRGGRRRRRRRRRLPLHPQ